MKIKILMINYMILEKNIRSCSRFSRWWCRIYCRTGIWNFLKWSNYWYYCRFAGTIAGSFFGNFIGEKYYENITSKIFNTIQFFSGILGMFNWWSWIFISLTNSWIQKFIYFSTFTFYCFWIWGFWFKANYWFS